jgi:eukaryotic translation initiation factor 2C
MRTVVVQGRGRQKSTIAVPMELLTIERGQKRRGLLIGDQQANLVRKAAQPPDTKRRDIEEWMGKAAKNFSQVNQQFQLNLEKTPALVEGRLLPAPVIQYGSPKNYYAGTTGAWNMVDVRSFP